MRSLMDFYNNCSNEDKIIIDRFFLYSINNFNVEEYISLLERLNNQYGIYNGHYLLTNIDRENYIYDLRNYLSLNYFMKYRLSKENIYKDPITLELLNNDNLFKAYLKPLLGDFKDVIFNKLCINYKQTSDSIDKNICKNYNNPYYIKFMIYTFINKVDIRKNIDKIIDFFTEYESVINNLNIKHIIVKKIDIIKYLFKIKGIDKQYLKSLKSFINYKMSIINRLNIYSNYGRHYKLYQFSSSIIEINISKISSENRKVNNFFYEVLKTIFHEIRHAYQCSNQDKLLNYNYERCNVVSKYDYNFYLDNYPSFEIENDAFKYENERLYKLNMISYTEYINSIIKYISLKYSNKLNFDRKVDELVLKNSNTLKHNKLLNLEYNENGLPKTIDEVLNNYSNTSVFDEIVIRCLNRMSYDEFISYIKQSKYKSLIEIILLKKIKENEKDMLFLENNNRKDLLKPIYGYNDVIVSYYLEIIKLKEQNRVAKNYKK